MRLLAFLILSCTFLMCKTQDILPADQQLNFIVILEGESKAKAIKNDLSFEMIESYKESTALNQWAINFRGDIKDVGKLRAELLNHPKVISVFTKEEFAKMNSKKGKKSKYGADSKNRASKQ